MWWRAQATITKRRHLDQEPYEIVVKEGNALMYIGMGAIWECLLGNGGSVGYYDNSNAILKVGDSNSDPTNQTLTDLQGSTKATAAMDTGFPRHFDVSVLPPIAIDLTLEINYQATFADGIGNFQWKEMGLFNGNNRMMNRFCGSLGTKAGGFWTLALQLRIQ